jgi:hypothetical protein
MNTPPTAEDAKRSLNDHVADKGLEIRARFGPKIGWKELQQILLDRTLVRYPCEVKFTAEGLHDDEPAHAHALGGKPEDGFEIRVHPVFMTQLQRVPHLVFYQLVAVNYGDFASTDDAETFGAAVLGMDKDDYYESICELADQLAAGCG